MSTAHILAGEAGGASSRILRLLATAAFLIGLTSLTFLLHLGSNPEFAFVFAGASALHAGIVRDRREILLVLMFSAGFITLYLIMAAPLDPWWISRVAGILGSAGCGSIAVLGLKTIWNNCSRSRRALQAASIIPIFGMIAATTMQFVQNSPLRTFDLYLYSFDDKLSVQASFAAGRLFREFPAIRDAGALVYDALAVLPPLVVGLAWRKRQLLPFDPILAFVVAGVLCFGLYRVCPGTAPAAAFESQFPDRPPPASTLKIQPVSIPGAPRNAMPSMHAAWTLLAWWAGFGLSWRLRVFNTAFLALTLLATLGLGEHYLCDLIVACSFALAVSALCCMRLPFSAPSRWIPLSAGVIATLAWLVLLRQGALVDVSKSTAWAFVAITVIGTGVLQARLIRAASATSREVRHESR